MTRAARYANLMAVVIPFLATLVAVVVFWGNGVDAIDLGLFAVFYLLTGYGVTLGFHRLLTHKAFETKPAIRNSLAVLGSMAVEGPVISWVADHRKHHAFTDVEGDPHSPHVGHGSGLRGLWHAHAGWLTLEQGTASPRRYAKELVDDRAMRRISDAFPWLVLLSLGLPAALGFILHGFTLAGLLTGLLWGGLVRIFFVHHVTWSINSVCHFAGTRRFDVEDRSTNVAWLAVPSFGEAWHHNHHAFPRSADHGLAGWERALDPSAWAVSAMEHTGLAWNVVRIAPERQAARLAGAPESEPALEQEKVGSPS
jgi:stearoyl-CoA desaturase (Delta-9 desaturase)